MKISPKSLLSLIMIILAIMLLFKACNYRSAITPEEFIEYMWDNNYFVASNVAQPGEIADTRFIEAETDLEADINTLGIVVNYYLFYSVEDCKKAYERACEEAHNRYFVENSSYELRSLSSSKDYTKQATGNNYDRYIIRNPERNLNTLISRVGNTIIIVEDASDYAFAKIKETLGTFGY